MQRTMNLAVVENAIRVVEEEFEIKWLTKKANQGKLTHPIPMQWKKIKTELASYKSKGVFNISEEIVWLTRFTEDLSIARGLDNYDTAISPRLKESDFLKVQYEIYVAAYSVRNGFEVQFVPTSQSNRTADLLLTLGNLKLHAECTQRDPYVPFCDLESRASKLLSTIRGQAYAGLEIIVVALSAFEEDIVPDILKKLEERDRTKDECFIHGSGYGIYVHPLPPPEGDGYWMTAFGTPPFTLRDGIFIPAGQNPAWAECRVADDSTGQKYCTGHWRGYLHTINSHNLATLVGTFNRKRQQIPKEGPGIIFVDLDVSHVNPRDISLYLDILAEGLTRCFSPTVNTRVWAIVLTTIPVPIHTGDGATKFITLHRRVKVVRNSYAAMPQNLVLPGESKQ